MSTIEVMRKALEALEHAEKDAADFQRINTDQTGTAITALRAELERLEAVEPYIWYDDSSGETYTAKAIADGVRLASELWPLYPVPIAPAIPAMTIEDVCESAPEFADVPKYGPAYLAGALWAYTLAAARTGARIVKADALQELADNAKQLGLEY